MQGISGASCVPCLSVIIQAACTVQWVPKSLDMLTLRRCNTKKLVKKDDTLFCCKLLDS